MDFLYHHLSEKDKEDIKKQVDGILVSFSKKLSEIKQDIEDKGIEREECTRKEQIIEKDKKNEEVDEFSRKKMFENAQNKNEDFIIAEKKKW
jgi:hypothetical protein